MAGLASYMPSATRLRVPMTPTLREENDFRSANPRAFQAITSLFGASEAEVVSAVVQRSTNSTGFFNNLTPEEIATLKSKLNTLEIKKNMGKEKAYELVKLTRLLYTMDKSNIEPPIDITGLTPKEAYSGITAQIRDSEGKQSSTSFQYTVSSEGKEYTVVLDPTDIRTQKLALEAINSCFSEGGVNRHYAEAYLKSGNIFFAVVVDQENQIVGRFTLGIGYKFANDVIPSFSDSDRAIARLSHLYLNSSKEGVSESDIDRSVFAYATHMTQTGQTLRFVESGSFVMKLPDDLANLYDDRIGTGRIAYSPDGAYYSFELGPKHSYILQRLMDRILPIIQNNNQYLVPLLNPNQNEKLIHKTNILLYKDIGGLIKIIDQLENEEMHLMNKKPLMETNHKLSSIIIKERRKLEVEPKHFGLQLLKGPRPFDTKDIIRMQ